MSIELVTRNSVFFLHLDCHLVEICYYIFSESRRLRITGYNKRVSKIPWFVMLVDKALKNLNVTLLCPYSIVL